MSETSPQIRTSQLISGAALIISLLFGAYYVSDSLSGRDTGLAAQMRVLGFCPDAERASTSAGGSACSELVTLANLSGDLIPSVDNTFDIGSPTFRWKSLQLGPGTLFIQDTVTGKQAGLTVVDGAFLLDGADSLRIGNIRLTAEGIESILSNQDITIGNFGDKGYALFPTGIKFSDGSTMTTAAGLGVAGTGGARGPRGNTGPEGEPGSVGALGPIGPTGAVGPPGPRGASGAAGAAGSSGATGAAGATGSIGLPGIDGLRGENGVPGLPGSDGLDGTDGTDGLRGENGVPGLPGSDGLDGTDGTDGLAGPVGSIGPSGEPGVAGATGAPGAVGATGEPGAVGAPGADGATGPTGPAGASGGTILDIFIADGYLAININKQAIILGAGTWSLADGVEGQVLYFIASTASDSRDVHVVVEHLRYQNGAIATMGSAISWSPFSITAGGTNIPLMTIAVFTQGAWNVSAGVLH
jgi:hypothetical protein